LAEVLKYGAIADADFFAWLESHADALQRRDPDALLIAIERSCAHKAAIVRRDERETGERAHLNFGHTFGHALEAATRYETLLHGEAIALGMVCAARLSAARGYIHTDILDRTRNLLQFWRLPTSLSEVTATSPEALMPAALLERMRLDKKNSSGQIRLILLQALGQATISHASDAEILSAWGD
jgi:3-dehydroquinate synthase